MPKVSLNIEDGVAVITINRPEKRNALNAQVRSELFETVMALSGRDDVRAMVITGAGDAFVAGADIAAMKDYTPDFAAGSAKEGCDLPSFIEDMPIPVIAAVNGWALGGGCELALACDIRICSEGARFGQPEIRIGIMPGYGATVRLPRLIGSGRAKELIFTGRIIDAKEAERIGLVNAVYPEQDLMKEAMALAGRLSRGPASIGPAKRAVSKAFDLPQDEAIALAVELYGEIFTTDDAREGISAYLEKRKPQFRGR